MNDCSIDQELAKSCSYMHACMHACSLDAGCHVGRRSLFLVAAHTDRSIDRSKWRNRNSAQQLFNFSSFHWGLSGGELRTSTCLLASTCTWWWVKAKWLGCGSSVRGLRSMIHAWTTGAVCTVQCSIVAAVRVGALASLSPGPMIDNNSQITCGNHHTLVTSSRQHIYIYMLLYSPK